MKNSNENLPSESGSQNSHSISFCSEPESFRFQRARGPEIRSMSRYLEERPKGLAKAKFSENSKGSFSIAQDQPLDFKPAKKLFPAYKPSEPSPKDFSKKVRSQTPMRNPILQSDSCFEGTQNTLRKQGVCAPSPQVLYSNNRKYCLPSESGHKQYS